MTCRMSSALSWPASMRDSSARGGWRLRTRTCPRPLTRCLRIRCPPTCPALASPNYETSTEVRCQRCLTGDVDLLNTPRRRSDICTRSQKMFIVMLYGVLGSPHTVSNKSVKKCGYSLSRQFSKTLTKFVLSRLFCIPNLELNISVINTLWVSQNLANIQLHKVRGGII